MLKYSLSSSNYFYYCVSCKQVRFISFISSLSRKTFENLVAGKAGN